MRIVFLCVANSVRSQIAEGMARHLLPSSFQIESAGSFPGKVHPLALGVLKEIGIEPSSQFSKSFNHIDPNGIDYVITLCAEEVCPSVFRAKHRLHWPFPDPLSDNLETSLEGFRNLRKSLGEKILALKDEIDSKGKK